MKPEFITTWSTWVILSEHYNFDPYKEVEFSVDIGEGNSRDFEYIGDVPEREEETEAQIFMKNWLETKKE